MESALSLRNLSKRFSSPIDPEITRMAVDGITLEVGDGEFMTMVGPSGCGKSTILRMIAGLEQPTQGEIYVDSRRVDGMPPRLRNIGFMFQGYALFKHLTVADNIGFGLKIKKMGKKERRERIGELVGLLGLEGTERRKPEQLSRGQQQRVALARALAPRPRVLLLDDPFGDLDATVRQQLRVDTKKWQRELKIPTILVTHDHREALEMGDRVAIMNEGRFEQVDTSQNIYNNPATGFVAQFIGKINLFSSWFEPITGNPSQDTQLGLLVRPEDFAKLALNDHGSEDRSGVPGTLISHAFLGRTVRLEVKLRNGNQVSLTLPNNHNRTGALSPGQPVVLANGSFQAPAHFGPQIVSEDGDAWENPEV